MAYDPAVKFSQPDSVAVIGLSPTEAEIAEARGRISAGEGTAAVWADIDARVARRWQQRQESGGTLPNVQ